MLVDQLARARRSTVGQRGAARSAGCSAPAERARRAGARRPPHLRPGRPHALPRRRHQAQRRGPELRRHLDHEDRASARPRAWPRPPDGATARRRLRRARRSAGSRPAARRRSSPAHAARPASAATAARPPRRSSTIPPTSRSARTARSTSPTRATTASAGSASTAAITTIAGTGDGGYERRRRPGAAGRARRAVRRRGRRGRRRLRRRSRQPRGAPDRPRRHHRDARRQRLARASRGDGGVATEARSCARRATSRCATATAASSSPTAATTACAGSTRTARSRPSRATAATATAATAAWRPPRSSTRPTAVAPAARRRPADRRRRQRDAAQGRLRRHDRDRRGQRHARLARRRRPGRAGADRLPAGDRARRRRHDLLRRRRQRPRPRARAGAARACRWASSRSPPRTARSLYVFDRSGRHLRTRRRADRATVLTLRLRRRAGRLTAITDGDGDTTTIQRDANGAPTAIVAPVRADDDADVVADGYLSRDREPGGRRDPARVRRRRPADQAHRPARRRPHVRVRHARAPDARHRAPTAPRRRSRAPSAAARRPSSHKRGEGRTTTYSVERTADGAIQRTRHRRRRAATTDDADRQRRRDHGHAPGRHERHRRSPGPTRASACRRRSSQRMTITTPGGRGPRWRAARERRRSPTRATRSSLRSLTETATVNGAHEDDALRRGRPRFTDELAGGPDGHAEVDAHGRPLRVGGAGTSTPTRLHLRRARPADVVGAGRALDDLRLRRARADRLDHRRAPAHDRRSPTTSPTGRRRIKHPDGAPVAYTYDADGNRLSVTPPGKAAHTFAYTSRGSVRPLHAAALLGATEHADHLHGRQGRAGHRRRPAGWRRRSASPTTPSAGSRPSPSRAARPGSSTTPPPGR